LASLSARSRLTSAPFSTSSKPTLGARGFFVATSGNVTDEVIAKCIAEQDVERDDRDFKVTE
jgi:hypothetical protein